MDWSSNFRWNLLVGLLVLMLAVTGAWAQTGTTAVNGDVTDPQGAAVAGVKVTATVAALSQEYADFVLTRSSPATRTAPLTP